MSKAVKIENARERREKREMTTLTAVQERANERTRERVREIQSSAF